MTISALMPTEEAARLLVCDPKSILDVPADPVLDGLVRSVASLLDCPIAIVSLVDGDRHGFKTGVGVDMTQLSGTPVFCAQTLRGQHLFEVPDTTLDARFAASPLVTGEPHVRFYAGTPLRVDGRAIGTLGVIDRKPRRLDAAQRALLLDLAQAVEHWIVSGNEHEQGLHVLNIGPVAVAGAVAQALALIEPLAIQYGVHLMPLQGDVDAVAQADTRALGQILLKLLSNGAKYNARDGMLWVEVSSAGPTVVLSVNDEGLGLSEAQHKRLFQPFERLGAERSHIPGSGLGLVITKQLVESMQGRLSVHERDEGGCRFEVRLPAWRAAPLAPPAPAARAGEAPRAAPLVLCVERDPPSVQLLHEAAQAASRWRLMFAHDGADALRLARSLRPDLIVASLHLPGIDAHALVRAVRADPALQTTRCIALGGDAHPEAHPAALAAGFDEYWSKPLDLGILQFEMGSGLQRDGVAQPGRKPKTKESL